MTVEPAVAVADDRIPVHVLTGFLGSGKTTFLRHLLDDPDLSDTAVVINEFGEVGLDHLLVREVSKDAVLLPSGCLCCAVGDDLASTLTELLILADRGDIAPFRRVVIETSGLADPLPIVQSVTGDLRLRRGFRSGMVVTVVDGVAGSTNIASFPEAAQQLALADCVILTKADLAEPWRFDKLEGDVITLNPTVRRLVSSKAERPSAKDIFESDGDWKMQDCEAVAASAPRHGAGIATFTVRIDEEVCWSAFVEWLELLLANRGRSILRVKGLLPVAGEERPVVIHGVQHIVHPPEYLPEWPDGAPSGWLVFIARDVTDTAIENSLPSTFAPFRQSAI